MWLIVTTVLFIYYTLWLFLSPFLDEGTFLMSLFPNRELAIQLPVVLMILGATLVGSYVGIVMVTEVK
ncbi:hypothetical protein PP7435_CHR1-2676 [Komagataella phaffii CBS 7435]|uniref:Dolichol phosphate-mannose biosynthesis regulatory protein n=2 Tax=Komagataella phaffii TaxID=460519 RepID=C4QXC6_KOMPG|nr:Hypothetical protein PAS_chr1-4_0070 [Komagataella phaffii GS115]CAH2446712.1 hypothetical protein BQ9382_C1-4435 [Komagataella phaffii CBS 7435]CAY67899.1 Hypothetical protein PAS_chr1-4_0070 [Komagataella phaffii GS115]SCV11868.1 hypothetical protein PP7435_CHR1-2676 [Komagataella phaffii CBS 7435]